MCICQGRLFRVPALVVEILSAEGADMLCCEPPPVSESAQLMRTDAAYTCTAKKKPQNNFITVSDCIAGRKEYVGQALRGP